MNFSLVRKVLGCEKSKYESRLTLHYCNQHLHKSKSLRLRDVTVRFRASRRSPRRECSCALRPARSDAETDPLLPRAARRHPCRRLPSPFRTGSRALKRRRRRPCSCWGSRPGDAPLLIGARREVCRSWLDTCRPTRRHCGHQTRYGTANSDVQSNKLTTLAFGLRSELATRPCSIYTLN